MIAVIGILSASLLVVMNPVYACQTNAKGCQKTQEGGTPAGDSPPEVSGCHFFDGKQQCVRDSTPP